MITQRKAQNCGHADYGWLKSRYTFSFGHYFDPKLMGYASLRVLNQDVLAPGASLQPRTFPRVDVLNIILDGDVEYRDSEGSHTQAHKGDVVLLATQGNISYSEHNLNSDKPLTRMQLWLNVCPERENDEIQRLTLVEEPYRLLASPEGDNGSLQLRQQVWIHHLDLKPGEQHTLSLHGSRAYVQSIHGSYKTQDSAELLACGDGAFINDEESLTLTAVTPLRALVIDLPV
ncbi:pirin family protein [Hafnia alvei]|uniref:pirin family protein n=1 Tax=Hafnia alvei TaxID=569 RepID=UPI0010330770|nr:pirin family protein [Hafnia alvei]TBL87215.1 pirin family protein [Hafnia alvei]